MQSRISGTVRSTIISYQPVVLLHMKLPSQARISTIAAQASLDFFVLKTFGGHAECQCGKDGGEEEWETHFGWSDRGCGMGLEGRDEVNWLDCVKNSLVVF